jgi:O-antigen biosynthesis protein
MKDERSELAVESRVSDMRISEAAPIIVAGMHRSGTSLAASLLQAAGVNMGERLMPADVGNVKGHFEDADFVEWHRAVLEQAGLHSVGWTTQRGIGVSDEMRGRAAALVARKAAAGGGGQAWGWKDPRTTLFLDFWAEMLPRARWMFIYRAPWEVADSLYRRGSDGGALDADPRRAFEYWVHYNRLVLEFMAGHGEQCVLVSSEAVTGDAGGVLELLNRRFGMALHRPGQELYEAGLMVREASGSRWPGMVARLLPECTRVYEQLQRAADLGGAAAGVVTADDEALARLLVEQWFGQRRQELEAKAAEVRLEAEAAARDHHARRAGQLERHAANLAARVGELERHAENLEAERKEWRRHVANLEARDAEMRQHAANLEGQAVTLRASITELERGREELRAELAEARRVRTMIKRLLARPFRRRSKEY